MTYYGPTLEAETAPLVMDRWGRLWERLPEAVDLCATLVHPGTDGCRLAAWRCTRTGFLQCDDCLRAREER